MDKTGTVDAEVKKLEHELMALIEVSIEVEKARQQLAKDKTLRLPDTFFKKMDKLINKRDARFDAIANTFQRLHETLDWYRKVNWDTKN